jgi:poly-gamma-glutamate synthesis protein (capsule biosynthesis protein)
VTTDTPAAPLRLFLGGDAMLGRMVGACVGRFGADYPLGAIAPLMRQADLAIVNLECAITSCTQHWSGAPKAFYFGAPPGAVESLLGAGIKLVSLANNHILDYGVRGLRDTIATLDRHGIAHAGAGRDLAEAQQPALVECKGMRFGMAAFCDHQRDFAAASGRDGMAWLDLQDEPKALAAFEQALAPLLEAKLDWPILSLHWGPNMLWRPSAGFRRLAQAAVDMGWKLVFGHSAHVFHGIELRHGSPILYAAGDLVDDYAVDRAFRNDHQLLFELELDGGRLNRILLHPLFIARGRTSPANAAQADWIALQMDALCTELGTRLETGAQPWTIAPPA